MSLKMPFVVECDECEASIKMEASVSTQVLMVPEKEGSSKKVIKRFLVLQDQIDHTNLPNGWFNVTTEDGYRHMCPGCKEYLANKEEIKGN